MIYAFIALTVVCTIAIVALAFMLHDAHEQARIERHGLLSMRLAAPDVRFTAEQPAAVRSTPSPTDLRALNSIGSLHAINTQEPDATA